MALNPPDSHGKRDGTGTRFVCSSDDGAWQVTLDAAAHGGRTTTDVVAVHLTRATEAATRYTAAELLAEVARKTPEWVSDHRAAEVLGDLGPMPDGRATPLFRAEIASAYVELVSLDVAKPVEWIAGRLSAAGPRAVTKDSVFSWLRQAREEGLLTSAGAGKAGGQLTKQAKALLSAHGAVPANSAALSPDQKGKRRG